MKKVESNGRFLLFFAVGLLLVFAGSLRQADAQIFSQDLTLHSTTTNPGMGALGSGVATTTEYFSKNAMRTSSSSGNETIIRFDAEKIITIDSRQKTYSEITFKQLQEVPCKAGAALGGMSSEQMAAMKKMMGEMPTSFSAVKVGPGETIAGYATEKYLLKGPMEIEIHSAASLRIPATYYDVMKLQMPSNPLIDMGKMFDAMKKISGIPLKTVTIMRMMGQEMKTTKVVTSIEKGAIPASIFQVPAGYALVQAALQ